MMRRLTVHLLLVAGAFLSAATALGEDLRNLRTGSRIPAEGYCDQPYIVVTRDGNWLCTLTTGRGVEGQRGQHVVSAISADKGKTWSPLIDIEPANGPEASWAVPLVVPGGRVYAFYDYNGDEIRSMPGSEKRIRTDILGWYVYRYSDDNGRSWSPQRYRLPLRVTACDRGNQWQGKVQVFWGIDKPKLFGGGAGFAFTKLGRYMLEQGEGWIYWSDNLLNEREPEKIQWKLLPEGEHGLRAAEFGSVQEEHNLVPLSNGALYCVYRTTNGYPCQAYSRDGGRNWTRPEPMAYTPGGRPLKHPRACPKLWRTANGKFLFWFHNHGGKSYEGRNPAWIAGGVEKDGALHWSQPEILLYDSTVATRVSYPDLIEQDGRYWVTETQKSIARVHEVDRSLLEGLWTQGDSKTIAREGLVLDLGPESLRQGLAKLPGPLDISKTGGLAIDCWIRCRDLSTGKTVLDNRDERGRGFALTTAARGAMRLELADGNVKAAWESDPGLLRPGDLHHVVAIVDGEAKIISFVVDGTLCDGGKDRPCGWGRYAGDLGPINGSGQLRMAAAAVGQIVHLRVYARRLTTSQAVANFHAGPSAGTDFSPPGAKP